MDKKKLVLKTCLKAGKIMTESGSEVYRVEDTMCRIAQNSGFLHSISYVTATGLFMSLGEEPLTQLENVKKRSIDMETVSIVNDFSRKYEKKEMTLEEFYNHLLTLEQHKTRYSSFSQWMSAGIVSCTLVYMFNGGAINILPGFFIGFISYYFHRLSYALFEQQYFDDFIASLIIGTLSIFSVRFGFGNNVDSIIIGAVMPLVPGVAITNSFRDIMQGHLIAGMVRGMEAMFVAGAIGIGIAVSLKLFL